jgi:hypothetical protein
METDPTRVRRWDLPDPLQARLDEALRQRDALKADKNLLIDANVRLLEQLAEANERVTAYENWDGTKR